MTAASKYVRPGRITSEVGKGALWIRTMSQPEVAEAAVAAILADHARPLIEALRLLVAAPNDPSAIRAAREALG